MKYKRIEYSKNFNIMGTIHEKMCLDAELEEGDDPDKCFLELKDRIHKWADSKGFQIEERPAVKPTNGFKVEKTETTAISQKDRILQDIMKSNDIKALESYKLLVKKDNDLQEAYDRRYAELTHQRELA